jgi:hypothetical protein
VGCIDPAFFRPGHDVTVPCILVLLAIVLGIVAIVRIIRWVRIRKTAPLEE